VPQTVRNNAPGRAPAGLSSRIGPGACPIAPVPETLLVRFSIQMPGNVPPWMFNGMSVSCITGLRRSRGGGRRHRRFADGSTRALAPDPEVALQRRLSFFGQER